MYYLIVKGIRCSAIFLFIFIFKSSYALPLMSQVHNKYSLKFISTCLKIINNKHYNIFEFNISVLKVWCGSFQNYFWKMFPFLFILKNAIFTNTSCDYTVFDKISNKPKAFFSFLFISLYRYIQQRGKWKDYWIYWFRIFYLVLKTVKREYWLNIFFLILNKIIISKIWIVMILLTNINKIYLAPS